MRFESILRTLLGFSVLVFLAWVTSIFFDVTDIASPAGIVLLIAIIVIGAVVIKLTIRL